MSVPASALADAVTPAAVPTIEVAITHIHPSSQQPRTLLRRGDADGLLASVRARGILQPLVLRPNQKPGEYLIVCGERRYHAAVAAGLATVPGRVFTLTDQEALELGIMENLHRQDLHPMEEAEAFARLQKLDRAYTDAALAAKVGKPEAYIKRRKRLLSLPPIVREAFLEEVITAGHADRLAKLPEALKLPAFHEGCFLGLLSREGLTKALKAKAWDELRDNVASVGGLQEWTERQVKQDLADEEIQARLPELPALQETLKATGAAIVELSDDHYLSPQDIKKLGVVPHDKWIEIGGKLKYGNRDKKCASVEKGVVLHGGPPRIVDFCRNADCPTHHPKYTEPAREKNGKPSKADLARKAEEAKKRAYSKLKAAAMKAIVPHLLKATLTPAIVKEILRPHQLKEISRQFGLDVTATNGVAIVLAEHLSGAAWSRDNFVRFGKLVGFDLGKFTREHAKAKAKAKPAATGSAAKARSVKKGQANK